MRKYRFIWLPAILLIYGMGMACRFGHELMAAGRAWQLWTFVAVDIIICVALSVFIRKRSRITTTPRQR